MELQKSKKISKARGFYSVAAMLYISLFEEKHNMTFKRWEGDDLGITAEFYVGDVESSVIQCSFLIVKFDIDFIADPALFWEWYSYFYFSGNENPLNYRTYCAIKNKVL